MKNLKAQIEAKLKSKGYSDHKYPISRRDLIKMGFLAGAASAIPLTFLEKAFAQISSTPTIPFLVFDLAGGAALPANFLVGQAGGPEDLCANYKAHGWNPRAANALDKSFGLPMSQQSSKILEGLRQTLPQAITTSRQQTMLKMSSFCNFSLDDTISNRSSALTLVSRAGLVGNFIKSGLGRMSGLSGGNSDVYLRDPKYKPKSVRNIQDILELTSFGVEFEALPPETKAEIFGRLQDAAAAGTPELVPLYRELSKFGSMQPEMDVRNNQAISRLYNLNGPQDRSENAAEAGLVFNVLNGFTGPGVLTVAGCDYHDNTQQTGDNKDLEIGQRIGRAIHMAHLLKKPLMIQIITDGGIYAPGSDNYERIWRGDANQHSLTVLAYFNPLKPVQQKKIQIGNYTANGQVNQQTYIGKGPENMALAVLANYLQVNGLLSQFEKVAQVRLNAKELEELLVFT